MSADRRRKLSRRDFILLSGAGVMGATGASILGARGYEKLAGRDPNSLSSSPLSSLARSLGVSGGGSGQNVVLVIMDSLTAGFMRNDPHETRAFQHFSTLRFARSSAFQLFVFG